MRTSRDPVTGKGEVLHCSVNERGVSAGMGRRAGEEICPEYDVPGRKVESNNRLRHANIPFVGCNSATGLAGELHCFEFTFTDMVNTDIVCPAIGAGYLFSGWITEVAGVISNCTAIFTCVSHLESPS